MLVNTVTTGEQYLSDVLALDSGGFVVSWQSNGQDGSGYGIFSRTWDPVSGFYGLNVTGDPLWVITGSFNMTQHATRNRENVIALYDPLAIQAYLSEFLSIWTESQRKAPRKRAQAAPKKRSATPATTAKNTAV